MRIEWFFIWTNLNSLHPRMLCAKFGWNWRRRFLNFANVFRYFVIISPWKNGKGRTLNLNKLKSPSPKDALCQVWLKLTQWFLRKRFFLNFVNVFSLFRNDLFLEKGGALHLNKLESPSPQNALCQVWLKFGPVVLEKKIF